MENGLIELGFGGLVELAKGLGSFLKSSQSLALLFILISDIYRATQR